MQSSTKRILVGLFFWLLTTPFLWRSVEAKDIKNPQTESVESAVSSTEESVETQSSENPSPSVSPTPAADTGAKLPPLKGKNFPGIEAKPPPASRLFLSLPYSSDDPLQVRLVDGPLENPKRVIEKLQQKVGETPLERSCLSIVRSGVEATRDKNYEAAENFFLKAIRSECASGYAELYLGGIYEMKGRYRDAIRYLPIAKAFLEKTEPNSIDLDFCEATLGRTYFRLEDFSAAIFHLDSILKKYPEDLPHLYFSGASMIRLGILDRGAAQLERVLVLAKVVANSRAVAVEAALLLAETEARYGQFPAALGHVKAGLSFDAKNARLLSLERRILDAQKRRKKVGVKGMFGL